MAQGGGAVKRGKGWRTLNQRKAVFRTLKRSQRKGSTAMHVRGMVTAMLKRVGLA